VFGLLAHLLYSSLVSQILRLSSRIVMRPDIHGRVRRRSGRVRRSHGRPHWRPSAVRRPPQPTDGGGRPQGCHNGHFLMKMSVRTSFSSGRPWTSSGRPAASAFTRGRGKNRARAVKIGSAWMRQCVRADMGRPHGRTSILSPSPSPSLPSTVRADARERADALASARTRGYVRADAKKN
jgi:hypothetical protein